MTTTPIDRMASLLTRAQSAVAAVAYVSDRDNLIPATVSVSVQDWSDPHVTVQFTDVMDAQRFASIMGLTREVGFIDPEGARHVGWSDDHVGDRCTVKAFTVVRDAV